MLSCLGLVLILTLDPVFGSTEDQLITDLLKTYNKRARPYPNGPNKPVDVTMQMSLTAIDDLDAKKQYLQLRAYLSYNWRDPRLLWNSSNYGGIERIVLHPSDIWVPEIALWNTMTDFFDDSHYDHIFVRVFNDSRIAWEPGGIFVSTCKVDIRYFPFDEQLCMLEFGNWANRGNDVNLTELRDEVDKSDHMEHVEWKIVKTLVKKHESTFPCCPGETFPYIRFLFHLKRKPLYFVTNIIIPSVFLSVLVLMVFLLPPESGEKISLGVTILVAYALFILMISESVPRSSDAVPVIVIYLMFFMACSTLAMSFTVLVLYLHHKTGDEAPPPWLLQLSTCLSVLTRCRKVKSKTLNVILKNEMEDYKCKAKEHESSIMNEIQKIKCQLDRMDEFNEKAKEWKKVASVLDRFFFLFFALLIIVLSFIILVLVPLVKSNVDIHKQSGSVY